MIKLVGLTGGIGSGKSTVAQIIHDGNVRLAFKRPWSDGTSSVELEPLALIARLAALVPSPRRHLTRYFGVLSSRASLRSQVVPQPTTPAQPAIDGEKPAKTTLSPFASIAIAAISTNPPGTSNSASNPLAVARFELLVIEHVVVEEDVHIRVQIADVGSILRLLGLRLEVRSKQRALLGRIY